MFHVKEAPLSTGFVLERGNDTKLTPLSGA